jgi:hypothetical protein
MVTKKYWAVGQLVKYEGISVTDVEGHMLGIFESRGLVHIEDEVAVVTSWVQGDLINGTGPMQGYTRYEYEDGSTIFTKTHYRAKSSPDLKTSTYEDGEGEYILGTGRFEGIKGSSSWKGKRITSVSRERRGDWIIEGTMKYTLTSK